MKWNGILVIMAFIGCTCLCVYNHKRLTYYKGMYERLNGDVLCVFGNERPSEESLVKVKDIVKSAVETNKEYHRRIAEIITLRQQLENIDSDLKEVMSRLIDAQQENRLLQDEIEILRKKLN